MGSTEAEREASGVRRLKISYRANMTNEREVNLNLILLQGIMEIDVEVVVDIFIKSGKRRIM